jgi:terminase small subunit-like protein
VAKAPKKTEAGRPCEYSPEIGDDICAKLADGWSLVEICKAQHQPARSTVHGWLLKADLYQKAGETNGLTSFLDSYVRAREVQADSLIDDILEIADNSMNDWEERENKRTGGTYIALNTEAVMRAKLRVETRFRMAERLFPKKWGVKAQLEHTGKNGGPIETETVLKGLSLEELKNLAKLGAVE